jgi:hypothetical protein
MVSGVATVSVKTWGVDGFSQVRWRSQNFEAGRLL